MASDGPARNTARVPRVVLGVVVWGLLTASFGVNAFGVVNNRAYLSFQRDSESLVVGRIVQARASGIWSEGGLTGHRGSAAGGDAGYRQYQLYHSDGTGVGFEPYRSHPGVNGWLVAAVDGLLWQRDGGWLNVMRTAMASLSAAVFSVATLAVWRQFGVVAALALFMGTLFSSWVTMFAPNLWWALWTMYLPMAGAAWCVARRPSLRTVAAVAVLTMGMKVAFTGYEYVTAVLVSGAVPFVYAWGSGRPFRTLAQHAGVFAAGMAAAGAVGLAALVVQNGAQSGEWSTGVAHVMTVLGNRTHGDPATHERVYQAALSASIWESTRPYLIHRGPFAYAGPAWWSFGTWCLAVSAVGIAALWLARPPGPWASVLRGLVAATALSVLAPLSWFVVFKGHSYIHVHMNAIVWYLPFVPVSLVLLVCALQAAVDRFRHAR